MDHRSVENLFVVVSPGLEEVCAKELTMLGLSSVRVVPGGVEFSGRLADIYRANLWSRCASRILVRLGSFRCRAFPDMYHRALRLPWGRFLRGATTVDVRVTCHHSRLMHGGRIAETLQAAIDKSLGRDPDSPQKPEQLVVARMINDELSLSIDSSGPLLHRRGYRRSSTRAPLRETLAAGILMLLDWQPTMPLADPMCGTGSFILEGAMMASGRAPGLGREFTFMNWPGFRAGLWQQLCRDAGKLQQPVRIELQGADLDPAAVAAANSNLASLDVEGAVGFRQCALADQPVRQSPGLLVCNPPYGHRLKPGTSLPEFYSGLGQGLARSFPGWRLALLCPDGGLVRATGLSFEKTVELDNGGLKVGLYVAEN